MGTNDKTVRSELAMSNKAVISCYYVLNCIFILAYLLEYIKGKRTLGYIGIFFALIIVPSVVAFILYKKNNEFKLLKTMIALSYATFYIFVIFTTVASNAFTYAIPMFIITGIYADFFYTVRVGAGVVLINVAYVVYQFITDSAAAKAAMANYEIQVLVLVISCIYLCIVVNHIKRIFKVQLDDANKAKNDTSDLLNKTVDISNKMADITTSVSERMSVLSQSLSVTMRSMQEVNQGTSDTVNAVQNQLEQTEQIQQLIEHVGDASNEIRDAVKVATAEINAGNNNVKLLIEQADKTGKAGEKATEELAILDETARKMGTIINVIESVTEQTSLLALNASIEAARAGEAGKGFAVVASEISSLAGQTSDATVEITDLITHISAQINEVVEVIKELVANNTVQGKASEAVEKNFVSITDVSARIATQSGELVSAVDSLEKSNAKIVENIQTISAITEEVTAHSNETYTSSEENERAAKEVVSQVNQLNNYAAELNK